MVMLWILRFEDFCECKLHIQFFSNTLTFLTEKNSENVGSKEYLIKISLNRELYFSKNL